MGSGLSLVLPAFLRLDSSSVSHALFVDFRKRVTFIVYILICVV